MTLDIIIRGKNGHSFLNSALQSIFANTPREAYRLILVDDGSKPPYGYGPGGDADFLVRTEETRGSVSAINSGLAQSLLHYDTPYVLICDNDIRVPDGDGLWLERFVREMDTAPPGTAAMGATTNFANAPQHILSVPQTFTGNWVDKRDGRSGSSENPPVVWFVSFCVLIRKDAIRRVGLWDTRYDPGNWEDTDYSMALRKAGYTIRVARSVYVHHEGHKTFGDDLHKLLRENQVKFIDKWGLGAAWDMGFVSHVEVKSVLDEMVKG